MYSILTIFSIWIIQITLTSMAFQVVVIFSSNFCHLKSHHMCPTIIYKNINVHIIYDTPVASFLYNFFFSVFNKNIFVFILPAWSWCAFYLTRLCIFYALLLLWFCVVVQINLFFFLKKKMFCFVKCIFSSVFVRKKKKL